MARGLVPAVAYRGEPRVELYCEYKAKRPLAPADLSSTNFVLESQLFPAPSLADMSAKVL